MNNNIIELELPKVDFDVADLQDKYKNGLLKDHLDAVNYIQEYYFESKNGMYYFYDVENDDFEFKTRDNFKNEVLDKVDNCKITSKIIKTNYKIYKIVSDLFNRKGLLFIIK
jgi:hypothetical protein